MRVERDGRDATIDGSDTGASPVTGLGAGPLFVAGKTPAGYAALGVVFGDGVKLQSYARKDKIRQINDIFV